MLLYFFYSKPVIFLQETVFFLNKIQLFVKYLQYTANLTVINCKKANGITADFTVVGGADWMPVFYDKFYNFWQCGRLKQQITGV